MHHHQKKAQAANVKHNDNRAPIDKVSAEINDATVLSHTVRFVVQNDILPRYQRLTKMLTKKHN